MNEPNSSSHPQEKNEQASEHPIATGLGAVSGGVVGAAIGKEVAGKVGGVVGGIAGAIAGGLAANSLAEVANTEIHQLSDAIGLGWGADFKEVELPAHYDWEELQALSKPQQ